MVKASAHVCTHFIAEAFLEGAVYSSRWLRGLTATCPSVSLSSEIRCLPRALGSLCRRLLRREVGDAAAAEVLVYASPFSRTLQTAQATAAGLGGATVTVCLSLE